MNAARAQQRLELSTGTAVFDEDDSRYRYLLTRTWSGARPATFIGLNPSTATATENDPTIRREIGFARVWGCGSPNDFPRVEFEVRKRGFFARLFGS